MFKPALALCILSALMCPQASAAPGPSLDLYFIPEADLGPGDNDGDGYGARALLPFAEQFQVHAEYQITDYELATALEITQIRAGGSMVFRAPGYNFGPIVEFVRAELDSGTASEELDGYGMHLRAEAEFQEPSMNYWAQVGFVRLDDQIKLDGPEYLVGASIAANRITSFFIDVRHSNLSDERGGELKLTDIRAGVRFTLN